MPGDEPGGETSGDPGGVPAAFAARRERLFGEARREVDEARARLIETMSTGSGVPDALDALERAVERRAARRIRDHDWRAVGADPETAAAVAAFVDRAPS
ncbi:hypothetical protein [Streptomyces fuscigenes]|uniref:hypothetical protein n=1 Tax=Streptomyces fuscigenes TaxID=1528880 RepID=UPI001F3E13BC|nr:hypothetical protein [Streptomyces fuscigenes]MCF3963694.1 hypothetical protein [Streptomyces fuscigenes]